MLPQSKGLWLVLATGVLSGVSIFVNSFAVSSFDAFIYTFLKNAIVAVLLGALLLFVFKRKAFSSLTRKHWLQLSFIGLIGGSTAFLLYFYALKLTTAINAGFLHKTIFIFATVLAVWWLKEKPSKSFLIGGALLFVGNLLVFSKLGSFSSTDLLILGAVVLWAVENVYAKKVLRELSGLQVAFGRMFFGAIFILLFLFAINDLPVLGAVSGVQWFWLGIVSLLLFGYVTLYYSGLKLIPVSHATALLMIGQPVTALLSVVFVSKLIAPLEAIGLVLLVLGTSVVVYSLKKVTRAQPLQARNYY